MRRSVVLLLLFCLAPPLPAGAETSPCAAQVRLRDGREVELHNVAQLVGWEEFRWLAVISNESDTLIELRDLAWFQRTVPAPQPARPGLIAFTYLARDGAKGMFWLQEGTEIVGRSQIGYWRSQVADLEAVRLTCP